MVAAVSLNAQPFTILGVGCHLSPLKRPVLRPQPGGGGLFSAAPSVHVNARDPVSFTFDGYLLDDLSAVHSLIGTH